MRPLSVVLLLLIASFFNSSLFFAFILVNGTISPDGIILSTSVFFHRHNIGKYLHLLYVILNIILRNIKSIQLMIDSLLHSHFNFLTYAILCIYIYFTLPLWNAFYNALTTYRSYRRICAFVLKRSMIFNLKTLLLCFLFCFKLKCLLCLYTDFRFFSLGCNALSISYFSSKCGSMNYFWCRYNIIFLINCNNQEFIIGSFRQFFIV